MGTSTPNKGQKNKSPLVPSFLDDDNSDKENNQKQSPDEINDNNNQEVNPNYTDTNRFKDSRTNFSRFASSGGRDTNSLKKALSQYVSSATGGSKNAATRMKSSKIVAGRLLSLFNNINNKGLTDTLKTYNLDQLASQPINQILTDLINIICLKDITGGDIDQGIARDSAFETLDEICSKIDNIEDLERYPIHTILEIFITNTIKDRVINDIGLKEIKYPEKTKDIDFIESQLDYFIEDAVEKSLSKHLDKDNHITDKAINSIINSIYESSFEVIRILGEENESL